MTYILVKWFHNGPNEPVQLYSELDAERWEVRKVEVFRDGSCGYASAEEESETTVLGERPVPPLAEIGADPQFGPAEITQEDFEQVWARRKEKLARAWPGAASRSPT